jgi:hypothetical protein
MLCKSPINGVEDTHDRFSHCEVVGKAALVIVEMLTSAKCERKVYRACKALGSDLCSTLPRPVAPVSVRDAR